MQTRTFHERLTEVRQYLAAANFTHDCATQLMLMLIAHCNLTFQIASKLTWDQVDLYQGVIEIDDRRYYLTEGTRDRLWQILPFQRDGFVFSPTSVDALQIKCRKALYYSKAAKQARPQGETTAA